MTNIEFKTVLNVLNISNKIGTKKNEFDEEIDIYKWHDFEIYLSGYGSAILKGKIPFEVAQTIYNKYPNNPYSIRINNNNNDEPINHVNNDDLKKILDNLLTKENNFKSLLLKEWKNRLKDICDTNPYPLYIESYHIDTKEGLLIVLEELHNYYLKEFLNESKVFELNFINCQDFIGTDLITKTNKKLIETGDFSNISKQWIIDNAEEKYKNNGIEKTNEDYKLKRLLKKFDRTVNPFYNEKNNLLDSNNALDKIELNFDITKAISKLTIKNRETNNSLTYYENKNSIVYRLNKTTKNKGPYYLYHSYQIDKIKGPTEKLTICDYNKYNLTTGMLEIYGLKASPIDKQNKLLFIARLEEAISDAENIINKDKQKSNGKVLQFKKENRKENK